MIGYVVHAELSLLELQFTGRFSESDVLTLVRDINRDNRATACRFELVDATGSEPLQLSVDAMQQIVHMETERSRRHPDRCIAIISPTILSQATSSFYKTSMKAFTGIRIEIFARRDKAEAWLDVQKNNALIQKV